MELIALVAFALALNMDSFAVGVAYGVRKITLPLTVLAIISIMFMTAITISMVIGRAAAAHYFSAAFAHRLGGFILLFLGTWLLIQALQENRSKTKAKYIRGIENAIPIHIRTLGLVIQIHRKPYRGSVDKSGIISVREVVLLSLALASDSFAAGFAVSMLGFNILYTALIVGMVHFVLTHLGLLAGKGFGTKLSLEFTTLPGFILIALGLFKMN